MKKKKKKLWNCRNNPHTKTKQLLWKKKIYIEAGVVLLHNRLDSLNSNKNTKKKKISEIKIKYLSDPVTRKRKKNIIKIWGTNCYGFYYLLPFL